MKQIFISILLLGGVYAQDLDPKKLEASVVVAANGSEAEQRAMEDQILAALAKATTRDEKALLCRQLKRIGSGQSVPALAALIGDAENSHMARFALESIPGQAATKAMREALAQVPEPIQAGLMASLAARGDAESVPLFIERLPAEGAIRALGLSGSKEAIIPLQALADQEMRSESLDEALLMLADVMLAQGARAEARQLYVGAFDRGHPSAAIQGLSRINDLHAKAKVEEALTHDDERIQLTALRAMIRMLGEEAVSTMLAYLPMAPLHHQLLIVDWLSKEGDSVAQSALEKMASSERGPLRTAAIEALGAVGGASTVPMLMTLLEDDNEDVRRAARTSLSRLEGDDVREAIFAGFRKAPSEALINLLATRREREAVPELLRASRGADVDLRDTALKAVGQLATAGELSELVAILGEDDMKPHRKAIESAIIATFREVSNPRERAEPLLRAYGDAPDSTKVAIVNLLGRTGSEEALAQVRAALESSSSSLRNAAVHSLSRWPTSGPINDLYRIAQTSDDNGHRVVALRGYVNMAKDLDDAASRYAKAVSLAKTASDKRLILSGLGRTNSIETLKLCQDMMGDAEVSTEAALACIQISRRAWRAAPEETKVLLRSFTKHEDDTVRQNAQAALERID